MRAVSGMILTAHEVSVLDINTTKKIVKRCDISCRMSGKFKTMHKIRKMPMKLHWGGGCVRELNVSAGLRISLACDR